MDKISGFELVPIFVIVFLACAVQAIAPVNGTFISNFYQVK